MFDGTACGEDLFCPNEPVLRWQMAVWIVRVVDGGDPPQPSEPRFDDVDAGQWWSAHTERMFQLGITTGCGDGTSFCPFDPVRRSHMAAFLARAFDLAPGPHPGFGDVPFDSWHHDFVIALARSGITKGCGLYAFCPNENTSRGQMATFLHRAIHRDETGAFSCDFVDHAEGVVSAVFQVHGDGLGSAFRVGGPFDVEEWLTAAHVVADRRQVTLTNRDVSVEAQVVGVDSASDVALLRTTGSGAFPLRFGRAEWLKPGADLYAVGYPLHEASQPTVSRGVLSRVEKDASLARSVISEGTLILTDAPINPGNSGGPLVDACGTVIGMNVAGISAVDVEGISWAVAETTLRERYPDLLDGKGLASSDPPAASGGTGEYGAWEYFDGEGIWGKYEGYLLPDEDYQSHLYVRCAVEGLIYSPEKYDDVFFSTTNLVSNDPDYAAASVAYRFSNEDAVTVDTQFRSNEETESVIFAEQSFIDDLSETTAGALYLEVDLDNGGKLYLGFNLSGLDAVVADLDCL